MGRPRLNRVLPKYASAFTDVRGKERIRLRRTGWQTIYVTAKVGTPEFTEAYKAWEARSKLAVGDKHVAAGSFDALISKYYRSTKWTQLKPSTQEVYRGELERFRATYGARSVAGMTARNIANLMAKMQETPTAANNLKKRLAMIFDFAILQGMRNDNPARVVSSIRIKTGGHKTWQEEQIEQFEAKFAVGTMPRLAFDLALYTAQRRSDVRLMGPQHIERGKIRVKQIKTDKLLLLPIHPNLARSIAATPCGHLAFVVSEKGAPYTYDSFGMWFMRRCRDAGLEGYSIHGLRKAASRRMAEMGLSNQLIKSITGHTSDAEVSRYTRDAEQERMADDAMAVMSLANHGKPSLANTPTTVENKG